MGRTGAVRRRCAAIGALLAASLALGGCAGDSAGKVRTTPPPPTAGPTSAGTLPSPCHGITYQDVGGPRPAYGARSLRDYPARRYTCRAFWLPHARARFTPQSLALDHRAAWVAGYTWTPDVADRACRLLRIDLRTGRLLADQGLIVGSPGDRKRTFCRHGGGLALDRHGLWIAEKERLWLLDPDKVGQSGANPVVRVWGVRPTAYGSTMVLHDGAIGLGHFRGQPDSGISWFPIDQVLAPGVVDLTGSVTGPGQLGRSRAGRIPGYVQGMTWRRGLLVTRSHPGCGQLVLPDGRRIDVLPGIEDVQFAGSRVWMVSESSSIVYQRTEGPMVPMLSEYDADKVLALGSNRGC